MGFSVTKALRNIDTVLKAENVLEMFFYFLPCCIRPWLRKKEYKGFRTSKNLVYNCGSCLYV